VAGIIHRLAFYACLTLTALIAAEVTARLEDFVRLGVPILSVPDHDRDLIVRDSLGIHGKAEGRFKKWKLNRYGFRGPELSLARNEACTRVAVLGASETFGLYESPGHEYPAQLDALLNQTRCYEVINAAVPGLTLPWIAELWTNVVSPFKPDIAVIYPTPAFYLAVNSPQLQRPTSSPTPSANAFQAASEPPWWTPRLLDRLMDVISVPAFIQRQRVAAWLADARRGRDSSWFFESIPSDRLERFTDDLDNVLLAVEASGARSVLVTHANGFQRPPSAAERDALDALNVRAPRAREDVLLAFDDAAADAVRTLSELRGTMLIDAAALLNGHRQMFAEDLVHFNDSGSAEIARLLAAAIEERGWSRPAPAYQTTGRSRPQEFMNAVQ
jgi:lysophospholipase L1-like esterase